MWHLIDPTVDRDLSPLFLFLFFFFLAELKNGGFYDVDEGTWAEGGGLKRRRSGIWYPACIFGWRRGEFFVFTHANK